MAFLSVSSGCFYTHDYEAIASLLAQCGAGSAEIIVYEPHDEMLPFVRPALKECLVPIAAVHASKHIQFYLSSPGMEHKAERMVGESVALAKDLGAPQVVLHAWDGRFNELDVAAMCAVVSRCAERADDEGILLSVEALPARAMFPGVLLRHFLDASPLLAFTLDFEYAAIYDMFSYLCRYVGRLSNVHLRDFDGHWIVDGRRSYVRPGRGSIDFAACIGMLRDAGYDGNYSLESPYDDLAALSEDMALFGDLVGCGR